MLANYDDPFEEMEPLELLNKIMLKYKTEDQLKDYQESISLRMAKNRKEINR